MAPRNGWNQEKLACNDVFPFETKTKIILLRKVCLRTILVAEESEIQLVFKCQGFFEICPPSQVLDSPVILSRDEKVGAGGRCPQLLQNLTLGLRALHGKNWLKNPLCSPPPQLWSTQSLSTGGYELFQNDNVQWQERLQIGGGGQGRVGSNFQCYPPTLSCPPRPTLKTLRWAPEFV